MAAATKFFLMLVFVFILSFNNINPLFARPIDYPVSSYLSTRHLLFHNSPSTTQSLNPHPTNPKTSTSSSFPTAAAAATTAPDRQFRAAAHEVPSGPNPESN